MTIVLLIGLAYAAGLTLMVGLCRSAAAGDRQSRDAHNLTLSA